MLEWHELEVDRLHRRPQHPVSLQAIDVVLLQLLLRIAAFKDGHRGKEERHIACSKDGLVGKDARGDRDILVLQLDLVLQE